MESPENNFDKKERPPYLYHGSSREDEIEELEPRNRSVRDQTEGSRVFASPDIRMASIFMLKDCVASGLFDDVPYAVILNSFEDYSKTDNGGRIYKLSSEGFDNDPAKGLGEREWTSETPVKPVEVLKYESTLDTALENGVQVYFVDRPTYEAINNSTDHGYSILSNLESENQRKRINVRSFNPEKNG